MSRKGVSVEHFASLAYLRRIARLFAAKRLKVSSTLRQDLIQNVGQDAAGVVVIDFSRGIEADF